MLRLLQVLCLVLVLVGSGIVFMSCSNGGNTKVRVINAIDAASPPALDVYINGNKDFPSVQFGTVYPTQTTPAAYVTVPSGSVTIQAYDAGTTTNPIFGSSGTTASLSGSGEYTLVLGGFQSTSVNSYLISDNNTAPTTGDMEVRVINASAVSAASSGLAVSIYQNGATPPSATAVAFGQSTGYISLPFESGQEYFVEVFLQGNPSPLFTYGFTPGGSSTAGQITTLVITDNSGNGNTIDPTPILMVDLN